MNRRLVLAVPAAAVLVGLGTLGAPAFAATVPVPNSYGDNNPSAPAEGTTGVAPGATAAGPSTVVAVSPATASTGSLPFTGSESLLVLGLAAGALTTGVVLVGLGRRRATS